ncbi:MAG: helix-turn-helix domain-containing protein, partial [Candidatus Enteromonas sp.]|nr:helix-turn-helix domain-containing protein [Candidatus Enteromonas sp.]
MEQSTKSKILLTALRMFALYGYEGTNLRDLASELGLSKSALYKHYKSKEDIWDSTMEYMKGYFAE